uniref:Putative lambda recombination protein n=1 Tax=viral metagenome TaxID=1070528 RepID=A0A6H2A3Z7_9ZZZZ
MILKKKCRPPDIKRKVKQPSKKTVKGRAWSAFSKYIRLRDALKTTGTLTHVKCITCGKLLLISFCDAGHFVSRRYNATLFDERNVNTQCRYCNRFLDGNLLEYRRQLINKYGEGIDIELEDKATEITKLSIQDLTNLENYYKIEVDRLKEKMNEYTMHVGDSQVS